MRAQLARLPEWLLVGYSFSKNLVPNTAAESDYFSALLRTHNSFIAPTQGKLLNYVERVPLGVVAQITVGKQCCLLADGLILLESSLSTTHC